MSDTFLNKYLVYIDSHDKQANEQHNDFSITVNIPKDVDQVCVLRSTIKKSYYLVQESQNTFTLNEGLTNTIIQIPIGNYSASSFRSVLESLLNTNSPNNWTYKVVYPNSSNSPSTGKYTFVCIEANPKFIFQKYLYEMFGFERDSTNEFISNQLTSKNIINFQLKDVLRIHSNIVNQDNNILQELSAIANDFSSIRYECNDILANSKNFNIKTNIFKFNILDEDANSINLSLNVLITLLFYKKNTLQDQANKLYLEYTKIQLLKK